MNVTYFCKQCGRVAHIQVDNQTYCENCGYGVELLPVPDEGTVSGIDCRGGRCEF